MSSDRMCFSTDDRIRNGARWTRIKRSTGLGLLSVAVVGSITSFAAGSADDLKLPASFRHWYHVNTMVIDKGSPLFAAMGKKIFRMGETGKGEAAKLAMNLQIALIYEGFAEALTLATKLGVDAETLMPLIEASMVRSPSMRAPV